MKSSEVRELTEEQIRNKLTDTRDELMKLRFQQVSGQLTDFTRLRWLRRDIARMETILNEYQRAAAVKGEE